MKKKVLNNIWAVVLLLGICVTQAYPQVNLYVSPSGNNHNSGTLSKPFQTIERALANLKKYPGKDVCIQLRGGVYFLDTTIVITPKQNALQLTAYQQEKAIISAGKQLTLAWQPYKNGIYKAKVPAGILFEQLYVNDVRQVLARYPNYDRSARVFHGTAADAIAPERVKTWANPVGAYVHALHAGEWGGFHYRIVGIDTDGTPQLEGGWQNNRPNAMHATHRFVENVLEELDAPGEWYFNAQERVLYFYPAKNTDLAKAHVVVSHLLNSIVLQGSAAAPVRNVTLKQLVFTHNERSFWYTKEPLLRSDWTIYRGGAVLFDGTENCKVTDCGFYNMGGNAIMLSQYNKQDTVSGCHIHHIGASAVALVGDAKAVRSPSFRYEDHINYEQLDKTPGHLTNNYPQQCVVTNNLLHDLGDIEKQATGVEIEIASAITVSHNSIYNTPRAGLNIGDGCFGGHILEYNDVFNTVLETGDHGAFNSWGRDRFWAADRRYMDSLAAVHPELILLDAQQTTIIRNNRFRCDHGWDIDLDDGSSNYHIYNNVCLNGGLKLREGFYRTVENNIMVNNSFHPHVWFTNSGDVFEHNIVLKKYAPIGINDWGKSIDRNLFADTAALHIAQANGTDANSTSGDAQFVDAATGNYNVSANSPALAIGFANFNMSEFGVQQPALKKIAAKPIFPQLMNGQHLSAKSAPIAFMGGMIKNVEGLGDRSAYGLPDTTGVVVVAVNTNTLLEKSGLKLGDVIRTADGSAVKTVAHLLEECHTSAWKPTILVEIIRNQQAEKLSLHLK